MIQDVGTVTCFLGSGRTKRVASRIGAEPLTWAGYANDSNKRQGCRSWRPAFFETTT
jgi:hypothetical protein